MSFQPLGFQFVPEFRRLNVACGYKIGLAVLFSRIAFVRANPALSFPTKIYKLGQTVISGLFAKSVEGHHVGTAFFIAVRAFRYLLTVCIV